MSYLVSYLLVQCENDGRVRFCAGQRPLRANQRFSSDLWCRQLLGSSEGPDSAVRAAAVVHVYY